MLPGTSPRRAHRSACAGVGGATLLELLVVLGLLLIIAALAVPNFERLTGSVTRNAERDRILDQFGGLPTQAMLQGRDFVVLGTEALDDDAAARAVVGRTVYDLDVPDGWQVRLDAPVLVRATGVCLGGTVTLLHDDIPPVQVELQAPYCRVEAS